MKAELQKHRSDSAATPSETPGTHDPLASAEDGASLLGKEAGGSAPQGTAGPLPGRCGAESDASPAETEDEPLPPRHGAPVGGESNGGCPARDGVALDLEQGPTAPLLLDGSALLDDDSNQPMPVSRFFGNVELMQVRPVLLPPQDGHPWQTACSVLTAVHMCARCLVRVNTVRNVTREERAKQVPIGGPTPLSLRTDALVSAGVGRPGPV